MGINSGEIVPSPGCLKNSDQSRVQPNEFSKPPRNQIEYLFNAFLFLFNFVLGVIGWAIVLGYVLFMSRPSAGSYISPACSSSVFTKNMYNQNFSFDLHVFVSGNETNFAEGSELIWRMP